MKNIALMAIGTVLMGCIAAPEVTSGYINKPAACGDKPYPENIDEGFVSLFNGKDLSGWVGATGMYGVETIKVKMRGTQLDKEFQVLSCFPERHVKGQPGNLCTEKEYENFILRFEFCMPENGNNGLGLRMTDPAKDAAYYGMCELQLLDDGGSKYYDAAA